MENVIFFPDYKDVFINTMEKNMKEIINNNWQDMYEKNKEKLRCKRDLDAYFTEKKIGKFEVDTIDIGEINLSTGEILTCDLLVFLEYAKTFIQRKVSSKNICSSK